jgi:twitching motility protein PilT
METPMAPGATPLLGRLAVHHKLISMDQLTEALQIHGRAGEQRRLSSVLLELGYLTPGQVEKLLAVQRQIVEKHREQQAAVARSSREEAKPDPQPALEAAPQPVASRSEAAATRMPPPATGGAIESVLRDAVARGASDVHLHAGHPIRIRNAGELAESDGPALSAEACEAMLLGALDTEARAALEQCGEVDFCYALEGLGRFRANVYRQQRGLDGVFRYIPSEPPSLDDLGLPHSVARLTTYPQGMVLVTGPAGCGKTSTLAALVDLINEERRDHILTIEDPIEYLHRSKRCLVNQRSVKRHTGSFARALRAALREDPDVIVIGELRDLETISLALSAAETGHLVLATLHTDNSLRTLNRMVGAFPADQQEQVRTMLSESLRAVLSQRLLPRADGQGRVAALETLIVTRAVGNLIRDNKVFQIQSILQTGANHGMGLLDQSIAEHLRAGTITREAALRAGADPKLLSA